MSKRYFGQVNSMFGRDNFSDYRPLGIAFYVTYLVEVPATIKS